MAEVSTTRVFTRVIYRGVQDRGYRDRHEATGRKSGDNIHLEKKAPSVLTLMGHWQSAGAAPSLGSPRNGETTHSSGDLTDFPDA